MQGAALAATYQVVVGEAAPRRAFVPADGHGSQLKQLLHTGRMGKAQRAHQPPSGFAFG